MKGRKFLALLCAFMLLVMNFSSCVPGLAEAFEAAATAANEAAESVDKTDAQATAEPTAAPEVKAEDEEKDPEDADKEQEPDADAPETTEPAAESAEPSAEPTEAAETPEADEATPAPSAAVEDTEEETEVGSDDENQTEVGSEADPEPSVEPEAEPEAEPEVEAFALTDFAASAEAAFPGDVLHFTFKATGAERVDYRVYNEAGDVATGEAAEAFDWTAGAPGAYTAAVTAYAGEETLTAQLAITVKPDYSAVTVKFTAYDNADEPAIILGCVDQPLEKGTYDLAKAGPVAFDGYDYIETLLNGAKLDALTYSEADRAWLYTAGDTTAPLTEDAALVVRFEQQFTKRFYEYEDRNIHAKVWVRRASDVPDEAQFVVKQVTDQTRGYNYDAYMDALNAQPTDQEYTAENTLLYDFAFMVYEKDELGMPTDKQVEFQPESGSIRIEVTFKRNQISNNLGAEEATDVEVIHLPLDADVRDAVDSTAEATNISKDDIIIDNRNATVDLDGNTDKVEFTVDSLSVIAINSGIEAIPLKVQIVGADGSALTAEQYSDLSDVYVLLRYNNNYYAFAKIGDFTAGESSQIRETTISDFYDSNGNVTDYNYQNGNIDVLVVTPKNSSSPLTYQGFNLDSQCNQFDLNSIVNGYKVVEGSFDETNKTATIKFSEVPARKVVLNLYDYDGVNPVDSSDVGLDGRTYALVAVVRDKENNNMIGYACETGIQLTGSTYQTKFYEFNSYENGNDTYSTVFYDSSIHTMEKAFVYEVEGNSWSDTYNDIITKTPGITGYKFREAEAGNSVNTETEVNTLNADKAYDAKLKYRIEFEDEAKALNAADSYYVLIKVTHSTGDDTYYFQKVTTDGENSIVDFVVGDAGDESGSEWVDRNGNPVNEDFTGNEPGVEVKLLKCSRDNIAMNDVLQGKDIFNLIPGTKIQGFEVVSISQKDDSDETYTIEQDHDTKTDYYVYDIKLRKLTTIDDNYSYVDILGSGINYGITADRFEQKNHDIQSNFAVNYYQSHGNPVNPNLSGNSSAGAIAVGNYATFNNDGTVATTGTDDGVYVGESASGNDNGYLPIVLFTDNPDRNKADKAFVHTINTTPDEVASNIVEPTISHMQSVSGRLSGQTANVVPFKYGEQTKLIIDATGFDDNTTVFVDGDSISSDDMDKILLRKRPNQTVVFNFNTTDTVNLQKFDVELVNADGTFTKGDSAPETSRGAKNTALDNVARHVVWNLASVTNATFKATAGMILLPNANSRAATDTTANTGWLITDGYFTNEGGEWHYVYADINNVDSAALYAYKVIDPNKKPTTNQKFLFQFAHYVPGENSDPWVVVASNATNNGSTVYYHTGVDELHNGWNVYRITEIGVSDDTAGDYVQTVKKTYYAAIQYLEITDGENNTIHIAGSPKYFTEFIENDYNITSESLTGFDENDKIVAAAVQFTNELRTGELSIAKTVQGTEDDTKQFEFTINLNYPKPTTEDPTRTIPISETYNAVLTNKNSENTNTTVKFVNGTAKVYLKAGEKITINGITANAEYAITESEETHYQQSSVSNASGTIVNNSESAATFVNTYSDTTQPETGSLTVTKTWTKDSSDTTGQDLTDAQKNAVTFTVTRDGDNTWFREFTYADMEADASGVKTKTYSGLELDTYTVTESNLPAGFTVTTTYQVNSATSTKAEATLATGALNATIAITNSYKTITDTASVPGTVTVNKKDDNNTALDGAIFTLYDGTNALGTYGAANEHTFTISTEDTVVANVLPAVGNTKTLTLKETTPPAGYKLPNPNNGYTVTISAAESKAWNEGKTKYVTTTTYTMTIDNATSINVTNEKDTIQATVYNGFTVNKTDGTYPLGGATFGLYGSDDQNCVGTPIAQATSDSTEGENKGKAVFELNDTLLSKLVPENATYPVTVYLKEISAPAGYTASSTITALQITKSVDNGAWDESTTPKTWKVTTTYAITKGTDTSLTVANTKNTDTAKVGSFTLTKYETDTNTPLSGAVFTLYSDRDCTAGNEITTITTNASGEATLDVNVGNWFVDTYVPTAGGNPVTVWLKETTPPTGHKIKSDAAAIELTIRYETEAEALDANTNTFVTTTTYSIKNGSETTATVYNDVDNTVAFTDVEIPLEKKDADGVIAGVTFTLTDNDNGDAQVASDKTGTDGKLTLTISGATLGAHNGATDNTTPRTFTLSETVPAGYKDIGTWTVTVKADGVETSANDAGGTLTTYKWKLDSVVGSKNGTVANTGTTDAPLYTITNEKTSVSISKVEINKSAELPGATIQILDENGAVVRIGDEDLEWVSDNVPKVITGLETGKTYTLHEVVAPAGYKLAESDTTFTLKADGTIDDDQTKTTTKVANGTLLVEDAPVATPSFDKKVQDINDSTESDYTDWQDVADHDIGDDVPFRLHATLPSDVTNYYQYHITFVDTMDSSLDFNENSVKVTVAGTETSDYDLTANSDGHGFTLTLTWAGTKDETTGKYTKKIANSNLNSADVYVEFTAELNSSANLGSEGNVNSAMLKYSNTPSLDADGNVRDDAGNENNEGNEGETDWDSVIVFTYQVVVNKVDEKDQSLTGATFTLEKVDTNGTVIKDNYGLTTSGNTFTFKGLDDGDYVLTETVAPAGYKLIDPIEFTVTAIHEIEWTDFSSKAGLLTGLSGDETTGKLTLTPDTTSYSTLSGDVTNEQTSVSISKWDVTNAKELPGATLQILDENNNVVTIGTERLEWVSTDEAKEIKGLETGKTYKLRETVAPDGYTIATDTVFTIEEDGTVKVGDTEVEDNLLLVEDYLKAEEIKHDEVKITKKDDSGTELPGAKFAIYENDKGTGTAIKSGITAGTATIKTDDAAFEGKLPTENGASVTWYLIETEAPEGYVKDDTAHKLVITAKVTGPVINAEKKSVTTTTYTMTIDGKEAIDVVNTKYTAKGSFTLAGTKSVEGRSLTAEDIFEFEVMLEGGGSWSQRTWIVKNDATGKIAYPTFDYTLDEVGRTYTYKVREYTSSTDKMTKDETRYEVKVQIVDNGDGTLTAQLVSGSDDPTKLNFVNKPVVVNTPAPTTPAPTTPAPTTPAPTTPAPTTPAPTTPAPTTTPNNGGGGTTATPAPAPTSLTGKKVWLDENNKYGTRPTSITVQLYANGELVNATPTWSDTKTNAWTYTFSNLPAVTDSGATITYTVQELPVENYEATVNGTTITNKLIPKESEAYTQLGGVKIWLDNDDASGKRPASITVHLLRDGEVVETLTVTAADGWKYDFGTQPLDNGYGKTYEYTVREDAVPGYFSRVDGMNLTNRLLSESTENGPTFPSDLQVKGRTTHTSKPKFGSFGQSEYEDLLDILDYGTPLWGQLLGTGDELPAYPFVFGGIGALALAILLITRRKRRTAA